MRNKIRSSKTAKKRFKITGTGKIMYLKCGHNHLLSKKKRTTKLALNRPHSVPKNSLRVVRLMLPNVKISK